MQVLRFVENFDAEERRTNREQVHRLSASGFHEFRVSDVRRLAPFQFYPVAGTLIIPWIIGFCHKATRQNNVCRMLPFPYMCKVKC